VEPEQLHGDRLPFAAGAHITGKGLSRAIAYAAAALAPPLPLRGEKERRHRAHLICDTGSSTRIRGHYRTLYGAGKPLRPQTLLRRLHFSTMGRPWAALVVFVVGLCG